MKKKYLLITLACSASLSFATKIGVLSTPEYIAPGSCIPDETVIVMDTENSDDVSRIIEGDENPIGYNRIFFWWRGNQIPEGRSRFTFCAVDVDHKKMPRVPYDYMVLRLDSKCPEGTFPVKRHHDTQDKPASNRGNSTWGNVWPNSVGSNIDFEFCFVPKDSKSKIKYPFDTKYGVFANPGKRPNIAHTQVHIDDEDSNNANNWDYYEKKKDKEFINKVNNIMNGSHNTDYHFIKWVDESNTVVYAKVAVSENIEKTYIAAAPFAPTIKGMNKSIVTVELKSIGDVKATIVGINGAVIANIAEKDLQPGIHQIKWNAGTVPNGRYIVKVEQNGMVNAKNVILK